MRLWEIHPKLVVFPLAFLLGGIALDLYAAARHRPAGRRAATSLLRAGVWTGLIAAAAGVLAFLTVPAHTEHAHQLMHWHIAAMATAVVLFAFVVRARRRSPEGFPGRITTVAGAVAAGLLATGAHLGGLMVFRGGTGVDPAVLAPEVRSGHHHGGGDAGHAHGDAQPKPEHAHETKEPPAEKAAAGHAHEAPDATDPAHRAHGHDAKPPAPTAKSEPDGHGEHRAAEPAEASARKQPAHEHEAAPQQDPKQAQHQHPDAPKPAQPAKEPKQAEHQHAEPKPAQPESAQEPKAAQHQHPQEPKPAQHEHGQEPRPAEHQHGHGAQPSPEPAAPPPKALVIPPEGLPPGEAGKDYTPVVTPNGVALPWRVVDGAKVFHLIAEEVEHEFAPGLVARCWGYNGRVHGPTIEAVEGDRVRIYVTNRLRAPTSVHWHGILLPNGMDGVAGLNQAPIQPGETFRYEFVLRQHGTHMYHPHHDEMTQMAMGLMGLFVIHPRVRPDPPIDRDFAFMLSEWRIDVGTSRPDPLEMTDFNVVTLNGRVFPGTESLVAKLGQRVRIRFANLSAMDHHPMHVHGYQFRIVETDGGQIPPSAQQLETTALVQVGSAKTIEFVADAAGDWAVHCHMTHHLMNQMGHDVPNVIGVDVRGFDEKVRALLPDYMTMGTAGMGDMATMQMAVPKNSIPMLGAEGPFGPITMGGMFTILKVRDGITDYADPGWYTHPKGTVARRASAEELQRDGIDAAPTAPATPEAGHRHGGHD